VVFGGRGWDRIIRREFTLALKYSEYFDDKGQIRIIALPHRSALKEVIDGQT
jgi:hypothetical protein